MNADVSNDHDNLALENEKFEEKEKEEAEEVEEKQEDTYETDESFIRDEELKEHDYEEEKYEERSPEDEEIEGKRDMPSIATISAAAEKPEEEVHEVIEPDHVLVEVVEVRIYLSIYITIPVELLRLTTLVIF